METDTTWPLEIMPEGPRGQVEPWPQAAEAVGFAHDASQSAQSGMSC